jgi:lipoyl(octanoyl) transferase
VTTTPEFLNLGNQAYADTYEQMRSLVQGESFKDQIWLLEHPSVYTLGTAADPSHVLNPGDIPVIQTDRGGEVTFMAQVSWSFIFCWISNKKKLDPRRW